MSELIEEKPNTTAQFKKQLPRNMFLQVLSFVINIGVGIWLVPYLVGHLGRAAYGLIPIAGMMTQYVSLISHNISASVQRFLTIALQRNDVEDANRIFNTAFFSYLALGLIQVPVFVVIIYYANMVFSIPEELYKDTIILLICSAISFLLNLVCSVFVVPVYANNRLDILRSIDIGRMVVRLAGIVFLFVSLGPRLRYVGYVDLSVTVILCGVQVGIGKQLSPILKLAIHYYDWHKVRELMGMGWWLFVNQVGVLLFVRTDVWICNRFVSPEAAGDYAAILQWSNLIREAGGLIGAVIAPMIVIYYARSEMENLIRLSKLSVRLFTFVLAIPISLLCVFSPSILNVWLGSSFVGLWPLMVIMVCHLGINVGVSPLFSAKTALNKVRWPGFVTLLAGVINLFLAICFVKYLNWGIYGVAFAGALVLTLKNALFMPIYGAIILRQHWYAFLKSYLAGSIFLVGLIALELVISRYVRPVSLIYLAILFLTVGAIEFVLAWLILPRQDRRTIGDLIPAGFRTMAARIAKE
jgi:membrane protein EpsK